MHKAHTVRAPLEVEMFKKCTPFWREARFDALVRGRQLYTQPSIFEGSLAELSHLMLSTSKIEKSHRIVSFLMLSTINIEEVLQICFVFDAISGFGLPSVIHNNQPFLWVSYS